jgi:hypothetical protein
MPDTTTDTQRGAPARGSSRVSDADIELARGDIARAFQLLGLVSGGNPVCPECGASEKGKVKLFNDGGWHCYKRGHHGGKNGAIDLLVENGGYKFIDAVNLLLGRPVSAKSNYTPPKELPDLDGPNDFVAVVDVEVYDALRRMSSVEAAQAWYGRWHIAAEAVAEVGACVAVDTDAVVKALTDQFGRDRMIACGIVKPAEETSHGKDYALLTKDYPIIEPYLRPDGRVVGMQFRASDAQSRKVKAYPKTKAVYDEARAAWEADHGEGSYTKPSPRFVPKFLSLRGAGQDSLIGAGLYRIARLEPRARIHIVEGPKDLMAARTLGVEAYAVSGVGDMPPEKVCRLLSRHTAVIRMDGDDAGREGAARLEAHFERFKVPYERKELPDGMDVTDILVDKHAQAGCGCRVCAAWRKRHS